MRTNLEEFSTVIEAIDAAAASPARWVDAHAAVASWMESAHCALERAQTTNSDSKSQLSGIPVQPGNAHVEHLMVLITTYYELAKRIQAKLAEALIGRLAVAGLDQWSAAAFIVDSEARLYHRNASSTAVASEVCLLGCKLRFRKAGFNKLFEGALRAATQDEPRASVLPFPTAAHGKCELTVAPLDNSDALAMKPSARLALVVIAMPYSDASVIVQRGRQVHGLTEAEARVMAALTLGATVGEIAVSHRVRPSTVRAQVRNIFEKTGVNRQSDLVRLALTGAPLVWGKPPRLIENVRELPQRR